MDEQRTTDGSGELKGTELCCFKEVAFSLLEEIQYNNRYSKLT